MTNSSGESDGDASWKTWLKRFGVAGFLFFFVKGLLWLLIPALLVFFGIRC